MIRAILSARIMINHGTRFHFCVSYPVICQRKYLRVLKKTDCKFKENFDIYLTEKTVLSNILKHFQIKVHFKGFIFKL